MKKKIILLAAMAGCLSCSSTVLAEAQFDSELYEGEWVYFGENNELAMYLPTAWMGTDFSDTIGENYCFHWMQSAEPNTTVMSASIYDDQENGDALTYLDTNAKYYGADVCQMDSEIPINLYKFTYEEVSESSENHEKMSWTELDAIAEINNHQYRIIVAESEQPEEYLENILTSLRASTQEEKDRIIAEEEARIAAEQAAKELPTVYTDPDHVRAVQNALNESGYDCGRADGLLGKKTYAALNSYQEAKGLKVSNDITDEVLAALGLQ